MWLVTGATGPIGNVLCKSHAAFYALCAGSIEEQFKYQPFEGNP